MSKTIYYLGAGASYGKRNEAGEIIEGIPIVDEIPKEFEAFRYYISKVVIPPGDVSFQNIYRINRESVEATRQYMLNDIDSLIKKVKEHATIDTYARKLYLTKNKLEFEKLKDVLCAFFVWIQFVNKPDGRYDTFLANILESQTLNLPKDISIISWNYDSQIETAYRSYRLKPSLPIYEKNIQGTWPGLADGGKIFKVNGSATFSDMSIIPFLTQGNMNPAVQLILFYSNIRVDTSSLGFDVKTHLSFSWEDSPNQENMKRYIQATTEDTEQVVVIGYSFPFFNRETDKQIFRDMHNLKKVYVQDINASAVMESIQAVLPEKRQISVVPISNCNQFYLPRELSGI